MKSIITEYVGDCWGLLIGIFVLLMGGLAFLVFVWVHENVLIKNRKIDYWIGEHTLPVLVMLDLFIGAKMSLYGLLKWELNLCHETDYDKVLFAAVVQLLPVVLYAGATDIWGGHKYRKLERDKDGLLIYVNLKPDTRNGFIKFIVDVAHSEVGGVAFFCAFMLFLLGLLNLIVTCVKVF